MPAHRSALLLLLPLSALLPPVSRAEEAGLDPVVVKARSAAADFLEHLPNYVCREVMTRYSADSRDGKWRTRDVVTTDLVYEDGNESYRNVTLNGRPIGAGLDGVGGSWSIGEFATELAALFSPITDAQFTPRGEEPLDGRAAFVFDYRVREARSQWRIADRAAGKVVAPAYTGSVWIDKETYRVLRIEKRTESLPPDFAWETLEGHTQYGFFPMGGEQALLPSRSENVSCQRRGRTCIRNVMDFREYRKFGGESTIVFMPE
jgi:hypothetical protein